ncbi:MAG: hypothetical protein LAT84_07240 [Balneolia bacterium]|nr:hypothetical protein [Balneolia bacterium]
MTAINKIPKLSKIPHLLNKKRKAQKESAEESKDDAQSPVFPPENSELLEKKRNFKKITSSPSKKETLPQSADKNIGNNLDLQV